MKNNKTLMLVVNVDWFFISHRLHIAKEAQKKGWKVVIVTRDSGSRHVIEKQGFTFENLNWSRSGTNPITELGILWKLFKIYKKQQPTVVHHVSLKPIIYGTFIAKICQISGIVNAISGLGYYFTADKKGVIHNIIKLLLRVVLKGNKIQYIFQNTEDISVFKKMNLIKEKQSVFLMKGVGVDLQKFKYSPPHSNVSKCIVLFPSRLIWEKGVKELKGASELLKLKYNNRVQFVLAGAIDNESKNAVNSEYLNNWCDDNYVKWIGHQEDMVSVYTHCSFVVFPSYREGMPKALLEACAVGRPIVTTNAIGCKDCVDTGLNGIKVPVQSSEDLAAVIEELINDPDKRLKMGLEGRKKAEREFNQQDVIQQHLKIYNSFLEK